MILVFDSGISIMWTLDMPCANNAGLCHRQGLWKRQSFRWHECRPLVVWVILKCWWFIVIFRMRVYCETFEANLIKSLITAYGKYLLPFDCKIFFCEKLFFGKKYFLRSWQLFKTNHSCNFAKTFRKSLLNRRRPTVTLRWVGLSNLISVMHNDNSFRWIRKIKDFTAPVTIFWSPKVTMQHQRAEKRKKMQNPEINRQSNGTLLGYNARLLERIHSHNDEQFIVAANSPNVCQPLGLACTQKKVSMFICFNSFASSLNEIHLIRQPYCVSTHASKSLIIFEFRELVECTRCRSAEFRKY